MKTKDFKDEKFLINICDQEPIHIPGSIQDFGAAIVLGQDGNILFASENIINFLHQPFDELIGKDCSNVIVDAEILNELLTGGAKKQLYFGRDLFGMEELYDVAILPETTLGYRTVEFEKSRINETELELFQSGIDRLESATKLSELFQVAVEWVKEVIEYDRVKMYVFDEDWNGLVEAEAKEDFMPTYLGLKFPASDIPRQARALYVENKVRVIADVNAAPVPLLPLAPSSRSIDLTHSGLRSVSPIHIEYLKNMNVGASFSVSIIQNGSLVGLIACHHNSSKQISLRNRKKTEIIGKIVSLEWRRIQFASKALASEQSEKKMSAIKAVIRSTGSFQKGAVEGFSELADILEVDGLVLRHEDEFFSYGLCLLDEEIKKLEEQFTSKDLQSITSLKSLKPYFPLLMTKEVAGMLRIPISLSKRLVLYGFRKEKTTVLEWGGGNQSNAKQIEQTEEGKMRVSPRKSFESYKERVRYTCEPWGPEETYLNLQSNLREVAYYFEGKNKLGSTDYEDLNKEYKNAELRKVNSKLRFEILERQSIEQKLKLALEVGAIGSWEYTSKNDELTIDSMTANMLDHTADTVRLESFISLFPKQSREELRTLIKVSIQRLIPFSLEVSFKEEGETKILLIKGDAFEGAHSNDRSLTGIVMDVSDLRSMQTEVQDAQNDLAHFFNTDLVGTFIADNDGEISQCNDYFLELLGYDRAFFKITTINWRSMSPIDQYPRDLDMIKKTLNGEHVHYERQFFDSSGKRIDVFFGLSYNADTNKFYGMLKNNSLEVVERNRTERIIADQRRMLVERHEKLQQFNQDLISKNQELEKIQEQFELISKNLPESIVIIADVKGSINYVGGTSSGITKRGNSIFNLFGFTKTGQAEFITALRNSDVVKREMMMNNLEFETVSKLINKDSSNEEIIVLAQNISQRKEMLIMREKSVEEAAHLAKLKNQFINTASHQLKTPMSSIELNLGLLKALSERLESKDLLRITQRLTKESSRLSRLMEDTLQISRINSDSFTPNLSGVEVEEAIKNQVDLFSDTHEYGEREILIEGASTRMITTDERLLEHVIHNVLSNSLKYSEDKVIIRYGQLESGKVFISIQDFGIGIPNEELIKVKEEFYRATNTTSMEGTGLGLYLVVMIMEKLCGSFNIESKVNEGTTVTLELP